MYQLGSVRVLDANETVFCSGGAGSPYIGGVLNASCENTNKETKKTNMENLFSVTVVSSTREILLDEKVVTTTPDNAKFIAGVYGVLQEEGLTLDDVTVIVTNMGTVKVKKDI